MNPKHFKHNQEPGFSLFLMMSGSHRMPCGQKTLTNKRTLYMRSLCIHGMPIFHWYMSHAIHSVFPMRPVQTLDNIVHVTLDYIALRFMALHHCPVNASINIVLLYIDRNSYKHNVGVITLHVWYAYCKQRTTTSNNHYMMIMMNVTCKTEQNINLQPSSTSPQRESIPYDITSHITS